MRQETFVVFFGAHRIYRRYVLTDLEIAGFTGGCGFYRIRTTDRVFNPLFRGSPLAV